MGNVPFIFLRLEKKDYTIGLLFAFLFRNVREYFSTGKSFIWDGVEYLVESIILNVNELTGKG